MSIINKKIKALLIVFALLMPYFTVQANNNLIITNMTVEVLERGKVKIAWNTSADASGKVEYGLGSWNLNAYVESRQSRRYHEIVIGNLLSNTKYYYQITAKNEQGQAVSFIQSFKTTVFKDQTLPVLSKVKVAHVAGTAAVISWESDKAATSYLEYGVYESYSKTSRNTTLKTSHLMIIKGLKPDTKYSLRLNSTDKDGNRSSTVYQEFSTMKNANIDNAALAIRNFSPNTANDPGVGQTSLLLKFEISHWAKARVTLSAAGQKSQVMTADYNNRHVFEFTGLKPASDYKASVRLDSIYGKSLESQYALKTKSQAEAASSGLSIVKTASAASDLAPAGFAPAGTVYARIVISGFKNTGKISAGDRVYLGSDTAYVESGAWFPLFENGRALVDANIDRFGKVRGVIAERTGNAVRLVVYGPDNGSDLSSVNGYIEFYNAVVDRQADDPVNPLEKGFNKSGRGEFNPGNDEVWIENANRSHFWLNVTNHNDGFYSYWKTATAYAGNGADIKIPQNTSADNGVIPVLDIGHSRYSRASALVKTPDSPDVYAIINGLSHYISSPQSFDEYGYRWSDIKTISRQELALYPRARLLKYRDRAEIYYLYQRPENQWLKIDLLSPTVFVSYPENYWGNVITVNHFDISAYPDVNLIKNPKNSETYYLDNKVKRFVSSAVFQAKGFNPHEIAVVSQAHFDGYKTGENLQ